MCLEFKQINSQVFSTPRWSVYNYNSNRLIKAGKLLTGNHTEKLNFVHFLEQCPE